MTAGALAALQQAMERLTVIDLRDRAPLFALRTYQRLGIVFERMPIDETQPLPEATIEQLLARVAQRPLLFHCWKGAHRTGAICALYRIRVQGWSAVEAWREMSDYGFGRIEAHSALFQSAFGEWRPSNNA